jgi:hypothetical protein
MSFGLLDSGLVPMRQEDIEDAIDAAIDVAPTLGENLNTDAESPAGQIKIIMAAALAQVWAAAEQINAGIMQASGVQLDNLVQIFRVSRNPATSSTVALTLNGTPATLIPAGSQVRLTSLNELFALDADATIGGGGTVVGNFTAVNTGPIQALAGSAWSIATPVAGWTSVSPNALDAVRGRNVETDGQLRARALQILTSSGGTSVDQLRAAILRLDNVTECVVIENDSRYVDGDGREPHSFEVVVRGGDDQEIADTIWAHAPAGILSDTTVPLASQVTATVVDENGDSQTITFSRPEEVNVWIEVDYTPINSRFPTDGEDTMLQALLDLGATLQIGDGLSPLDVQDALYEAFEGPRSVYSHLAVRLGLTVNPPLALTVPTSRTQLAVIDSSRIMITRV